MATTGEVSGVTLEYVAREIKEPIQIVSTRFDRRLGENVQETKDEQGVIVFFPNKTTQVMATKKAELAGFLSQPEILNFAQVDDQKTPAGRYKHAIREADRLQAWLDMENNIITSCVSGGGHPLAITATYSDDSLYLDKPRQKDFEDAPELLKSN